jgi:mono/diheme cytochrome c family protein
MQKNKHLLLWTSLATLALLVAAAVQENVLRDWRRAQRSARGPDGPIEVRLRQVVVPAQRSVDRCVTCHVGMQAGEPTVAGDPVLAPHPDVGHDPNELGCTACHAGQGRATEVADAHGDVHFWPTPMIPLRHADAGCGSCHTHLAVMEWEQLQRGAALVERNDCLACHALDGRGGTLRPGGELVAAPDLSRVGARGFAADWYERHLARRAAAADGPWAASFGIVPAAERAELARFLGTRVGAPKLVAAKSLFHSLGCRGCHQVNGVGGDDGPDLSRAGERDPGRTDFTHVAGERTVPNWFAEHFRSPATVVPGSKMPELGLSDEEIELLTHYMLSLRRSEEHEAHWPRDRVSAERFGQREFATDGATLYGAFCAACHGTSGEGVRYTGTTPFPAIASPDFLAVASDEFLRTTIAHGRPGRRMPAWNELSGGLRASEIESLIAHLRALGGDVAFEGDSKPVRWARGDADLGARLYATQCASCHGARGEGGEGLALANPALLASATDTYLFESIARGRSETTMPGFARASPVRPALSAAEIEALVTHLRTWEVGP